MSNLTRITVTAPTTAVAQLDADCLRLGRSRSAAVTEAIALWLHRQASEQADRAYVEGYRRIPEPPQHAESVAAGATAHWAPWP